MLIFPLAWIGIVTAIRGAWKTKRDTPPATARQTVTLVLLFALAFQALLFGAMRIPAAPQYYFGTFPLQVLVAWLAVDGLRKWRLGTVLGGLYAIGSATLTVEAAISIHHHGFERPLWPTLSNSVNVAHRLNTFSDTTALTDFVVYERAPQALRTLRLLLPPEPSTTPSENGRLVITRDPQSMAMPGATAVTELGPGLEPSPRMQRIEITPLPKDWVPDPSTW
jgi:hypothetical protein